MHYEEILSRLTGISVPLFGVQWNPPTSEVTIARRIIRFLEDRRVLYNDYELEIPNHCVQSVIATSFGGPGMCSREKEVL